MASGDKCKECGTAIPADSPGGFCGQCLFGLGLREVKSPESEARGQQTEGGGQRAEAGQNRTSLPTEKPGERIGRYRLLQEIGHGGCGIVYLAEQEQPVRRKVALKVIKLGMDTQQVVARFEAERQALALMDHPNIAKILEAGATQTGRPYFVMELVGGIKITDYCEQNNLTTGQRLDLFIQVCKAIQHAHQKGIIHRDLKPSNVLVATQDGVPVPKVIDFGIAKATQGKLTDQTVFTAFEQFLGTPAYMSPEQTQLGSLDVDTRSDIYSLGVLLYELLTGTTPFDTKKLVAAGLDEMRRTIREVEPIKPSARLTQTTKSETGNPKSEKSAIGKPQSAIPTDLDWIVMKCLEKDRALRYETANGLARDIERHLNSEPVTACPPSRAYLICKLIRRRRREALLGAVSLLLFFSIAVLTYTVPRAHKAQLEAQLAGLREEESDVLSKVIAKVPLTDNEKEQAKVCISRLDERLKKGFGTETDCGLMARLLTRNIAIEGKTIQDVTKPSMSFNVTMGGNEFDVKGVGVILWATAALDGIGVRISSEWPIYCPGDSRTAMTVAYDFKLQLDGVVSAAGFHDISCVLEAQLVHASSSKRSGPTVGLTDHLPIGRPVRIALPPARRLFVRELPEGNPGEIQDRQTSELLLRYIRVSDVVVFDDPKRGLLCKFSIQLPVTSPIIPLAIQVNLATEWEESLRRNLGVITRDERGSYSNASLGALDSNRISFTDGQVQYDWTFQMPSPNRSAIRQSGGNIPVEVTLRSSREAARSRGLEYFLSVPEFKKLVSLVIESK